MIIANIKSFSHFKSIINLVDGVILTSKYSISVNKALSDEEMNDIISYANKYNKIAIIDVSSLMTNEEMDELESFIRKYKDCDVNFLYTDLGTYTILKKLNITNRGIYDPKTLVTNSYDMNLYLENDIMAIGLSNEIPAADIKILNSKKNGKTWLKVFGYHQMFYSKRHLLSVYHEYKGIDRKINRENTFIVEETRKESYHIDENSHGSVIYRSYPISYMKAIDDVIDTDYLVLDSSFISDDDFLYALTIYKDVLDNKMDKNMAVLKLNERFMIEDGFLFSDTVYVKEESNR